MFLTFSNSTLLIGLAGAVVPLVLHLLSRARYESVEWGAMLFLDGLEARPQHTNKINQFALMLMRIGLVALLAIALAQPVLQAWGPEADSTVAALRVANRGQLLCLAGAIVCAAIAIGFLVITFRWGPAGEVGSASPGIPHSHGRRRGSRRHAGAALGILGWGSSAAHGPATSNQPARVRRYTSLANRRGHFARLLVEHEL